MLTVAQVEELCRTFAGKLISEKIARVHTNRFILENLRDGFCAGRPRLVVLGQDPVWSVPILFARPEGVPGEVGEMLVHAFDGSPLGFTPPLEIYRNSRPLTS